jgi:hypothetical protein
MVYRGGAVLLSNVVSPKTLIPNPSPVKVRYFEQPFGAAESVTPFKQDGAMRDKLKTITFW